MNIEKRDYAPHVVRCGWQQGNNKIAMAIKFGLHHIKGNKAPYFSVTVDGYTNGREDFGGCCHELVMIHAPDLADMVELHLSDIDGTPMHAVGNGWYWIAGMLGGAGEAYHGGSGGNAKTATECGDALADHLRITQREAWELAAMANSIGRADGWKAAKESFTAAVEAMKPRWKREAEAAIRKYGLGVYGDIHKAPSELLAEINQENVS